MVKVLLQFLIDKVDHKLLKGVEIKDFESSDIQYTNKVDLFHGGINQGVITHINQVSKEASKDILNDGVDSNFNGVEVLGFGNPFRSDLWY